MEENRMPIIGDKFPVFEAVTTHGKKDLPGDYRGKWFILFSHPADFTPVCTTEFYAFQKRYQYFKDLDCELIGLSIDQVFSHIKWIEWIGQNLGQEIEFPIIADDQGEIAKKLNMVHPGKGANTVRAVFIVDNLGVIRTILYYPQELGRNIDEILRIIKSLQVSEQKGVAIPANWPNNEIIGNRGIIPPPKDEKTAKERIQQSKNGEFECKDWWFCYKNIFEEEDYSLETKDSTEDLDYREDYARLVENYEKTSERGSVNPSSSWSSESSYQDDLKEEKQEENEESQFYRNRENPYGQKERTDFASLQEERFSSFQKTPEENINENQDNYLEKEDSPINNIRRDNKPAVLYQEVDMDEEDSETEEEFEDEDEEDEDIEEYTEEDERDQEYFDYKYRRNDPGSKGNGERGLGEEMFYG